MTKFVTRNFQKKDTILEIGEHKIGGGHFLLIAGPCSVENKEYDEREGHDGKHLALQFQGQRQLR